MIKKDSTQFMSSIFLTNAIQFVIDNKALVAGEDEVDFATEFLANALGKDRSEEEGVDIEADIDA
jgi:hypothetical protein